MSIPFCRSEGGISAPLFPRYGLQVDIVGCPMELWKCLAATVWSVCRGVGLACVVDGGTRVTDGGWHSTDGGLALNRRRLMANRRRLADGRRQSRVGRRSAEVRARRPAVSRSVLAL